MTRIAFLCCHLTGTGHLVRTLALARAAVAEGAEAMVISGGRALEHVCTGGVRFVQLPPVAVRDLDYATLRTPEGALADARYMETRRGALEEVLGAFRADALVTETFPLGRRALAAEFEAAIAAARAARPGAAVIASVRDVPEPPSAPERVAQAAARLRKHYDAVLVHGDEDFLPLSTTWPLPDDLGPLIRYAGYIADAPPASARPGATVLVAGGGGALGDRLLTMAAEAAAFSNRPWHLLTGGAAGAQRARDLAAKFGRANLVVEPARPDYRALLAEAAASVSLAGYNTFAELAACATPAILVPFDERGEREQVIRAEHAAQLDGFSVLRLGALDARALAGAAERAAAGPRRAPLAIARDGARRAAAIILEHACP